MTTLKASISEFKHHPGPIVEATVELAPGIQPGGPPVDVVQVITIAKVDMDADTLNEVRRKLAASVFKTLQLAATLTEEQIADALIRALDRS